MQQFGRKATTQQRARVSKRRCNSSVAALRVNAPGSETVRCAIACRRSRSRIKLARSKTSQNASTPQPRSAAHHPSVRCAKCSGSGTLQKGSGGKSVLNEARQHGTISKTRQQRPSGGQEAGRVRLQRCPLAGSETSQPAMVAGANQVATKQNLPARQ